MLVIMAVCVLVGVAIDRIYLQQFFEPKREIKHYIYSDDLVFSDY